MNKLVTELSLYDIAGTEGVAADLSHCNTPVVVTAFTGKEKLADCLKGADLVVIPAGVPRKPGMTRDDLFNTNASALLSLEFQFFLFLFSFFQGRRNQTIDIQ
jgi:malate dehydrogenase